MRQDSARISGIRFRSTALTNQGARIKRGGGCHSTALDDWRVRLVDARWFRRPRRASFRYRPIDFVDIASPLGTFILTTTRSDLPRWKVAVDVIIEDLIAQQAELRALIAPCGDIEFHAPTPCEGWDVADVLLHLAATNELSASSARGELDHLARGFVSMERDRDQTVDEAAAAQVASEREIGGAAIAKRWEASAEELVAEFRRGDPHRRVTWVSGKLSLHTLAATRLSETWIHTNDIAEALAVDVTPTDRLRHIARLAWRTIPYAFSMSDATLSGPVAVHLVAPSGAQWDFVPDEPTVTTIRGTAIDFCNVAGRRKTPNQTALQGEGPDVGNVLALVRTYAK